MERFVAHKILNSLPKRVVIRGQLDSTTYVPVRDPLDFLLACLLGKSFKWPSLTFYRQRESDSIGGIDFELVRGLPPRAHTGQWYWPGQSTRDVDGFDSHAPRYDNARDAVVASLKQHSSHATIWTRAAVVYADSHPASIIVRSFFDDLDSVRPGTVEGWWIDWIRALRANTATYLWQGSDDPMSIAGSRLRGHRPGGAPLTPAVADSARARRGVR